MLFTTARFALLFLPIALLGFFLIARRSHGIAALWMFAASVVFYGYWMPRFTPLLLGSVAVNFAIGRRISGLLNRQQSAAARGWLIAGVVFNLTLLGYFKYANFFADSLQELLGAHWQLPRILLPIGISFFTFTQIAFLADAYQKGVREYKFAHYGLFVTYFPHLVAGPVLHHSQMMPQFERGVTYRFQFANFAAGMAIFVLGLIKKVVVADGIAPYADAVFYAAGQGQTPACAEAWLGALAYTFQLYFDFSGYSDMAIGLSWLLNVRLPFNFDSPYKSRSITEFWRRWHMTLSAFLRDYLYIPLGGNRHGPVRRYINLAVTMLLGGLWHGASWTFVFWGGLHGLYLGVNHAFRALTARAAGRLAQSPVFALASWAVTALAVVVGWVFFRAPSFPTAATMLRAMLPLATTTHAGIADRILLNAGLDLRSGLLACLVLTAVCAFAPNSNLIGERLRALCAQDVRWCGLICGAALLFAVFLIVINESRDSVSAFIYFNF